MGRGTANKIAAYVGHYCIFRHKEKGPRGGERSYYTLTDAHTIIRVPGRFEKLDDARAEAERLSLLP